MGERQKFSVEDKREIVTMADSLGRPGFIFWARGGVLGNVRQVRQHAGESGGARVAPETGVCGATVAQFSAWWRASNAVATLS